jgi:hypothetical protein
MIPDPAPPFEVEASGLAKERIRQMLRQAIALGVYVEISRSLSDILQRLTSDPRSWGDPLWHFRSLQMTQFGRSIHGFRCEYSVHDRIPTVVLTNLFPLPGNPLHGENFDD